ncbi:DUF550 domain-containing protein [Klebsiella pneumoniae]
MTNTQLTEKRARLRKAAQDYQSTLSWYQENLDSPNAEQDCDEASAAFKREIGYREMDIIADLLDEIDELQEPRKPLQDKDLQGVIDALEHPAGINAAGKQVVRLALVELQERRRAESEPVGWTDEVELRDVEKSGCGYLFKATPITPHADPRRVILLYRHAQLAPERDQVRSAHAEWSQAAFGNVGPVGPLKHLSKEALEAAAAPGDLSEWADMQFLLWDAQRRAGITDEQITQAIIDKLAVNKQRSWPEPKDGEPRLHIKEQPRKKVDRCDVCTEGARGGCGTCIFNGNFE